MSSLALIILCGALVAVGVYLILERSLSRIILGLAALSNGINILFLIAGGPSGEPAIVGSAEPSEMADPLVQAMVLTAIVITLGMTGKGYPFSSRGSGQFCFGSRQGLLTGVMSSVPGRLRAPCTPLGRVGFGFDSRTSSR